MAKIKLVVLNEHTLGYIQPEMPKYVYYLRDSILKGAPNNYNRQTNTLLSPKDKVRLASEKDFEDFRCVFGSFGNKEEYEYAE